MSESFVTRWTRVIKTVPLKLCGLHPQYSEGSVYKWRCDKCDFSKPGYVDEKPPCQRYIPTKDPTQ